MRLILLFISSFLFHTISADHDISELRRLYYKAAVNKKSWKQFSSLLSPIDTKSAPLFICYKGVGEMMEAKYSIAPWSKLSSFKSGKRLIEEAVRKDGKNPEIRFLRYSIQTNLPSFLDYKDDIESDRKFLVNNLNKIQDKSLKSNIVQYLLDQKAFSDEELKRLNNDG